MLVWVSACCLGELESLNLLMLFWKFCCMRKIRYLKSQKESVQTAEAEWRSGGYTHIHSREQQSHSWSLSLLPRQHLLHLSVWTNFLKIWEITTESRLLSMEACSCWFGDQPEGWGSVGSGTAGRGQLWHHPSSPCTCTCTVWHNNADWIQVFPVQIIHPGSAWRRQRSLAPWQPTRPEPWTDRPGNPDET